MARYVWAYTVVCGKRNIIKNRDQPPPLYAQQSVYGKGRRLRKLFCMKIYPMK